jgi:hypothetical protein
VGSGAFRERGSERGGSAGCRFGSGPGAARERGGAWRFGNWQGAWGRGRERGSGGRERGGERASGTLPLGARFGVRTGGGGTVRQPGLTFGNVCGMMTMVTGGILVS